MVIGSGWRNSEFLEKRAFEGRKKNETKKDPRKN